MKLCVAIGLGLISGAVLYFAPAAQACSCDGSAAFTQTAATSALVLRGKVVEYVRPGAMVVEVAEVLQGVAQSKRVTIAGDNGMICRRYVREFPVGTEWVWALSPDTWSKNGELAISSCGEYALSVKGSKVQGRISPKTKVAESMTLPKLRQVLRVKPKVAVVKGQCPDRVAQADV